MKLKYQIDSFGFFTITTIYMLTSVLLILYLCSFQYDYNESNNLYIFISLTFSSFLGYGFVLEQIGGLPIVKCLQGRYENRFCLSLSILSALCITNLLISYLSYGDNHHGAVYVNLAAAIINFYLCGGYVLMVKNKIKKYS